MPRSIAFIATVLFLYSGGCLTSFAEIKSEPLWPEGAPGALGEEEKDKPQLMVSLPSKEMATGAAIVICPGGGYGHLAMDHEGRQVAEWLNSFGVAAFICDYRHKGKGYRHPAPMQDVQRAIRTVRARAKEFNVQPDRIGVLGFSAGGHLASTAATHFDAGNADSKDVIEQASCRPDFAVLCYAVIAFNEPFTHRGSQNNLLGSDADEELIKKFSNEKQVTAETPPTFLWHTSEDTGVPPQNSIVFYEQLKKHKVPAEMHIFAKGRHGTGLAKSVPGANMWPALMEEWMKTRGLLGGVVSN